MTTKTLRLHLIRTRALIAGVLLLTTILISGGPVRADDEDSRPRFNRPGNIIIADQFNNRATTKGR